MAEGLLQRWVQADPEKVRIDSDGRNARISDGQGFGINVYPGSLLVDPKVLGFIVAAIGARGWEFELNHMGYMDVDTPRRFDAHVWTSGETAGSTGQASAAEALLTAYLDAVEGETGDA